jgi:pantothenate kinase
MTEFQVNINGIDINAKYSDDEITGIFEPLLKKLTEIHKEKGRRVLVFLAAPPGAGKSTLASFLEHLSKKRAEFENLQAIGMDGFHRRQEYLQTHSLIREGKEVSMVEVKGTPETFDLEKLENAIKIVLNDKTCGWPAYDRLLHNPVENAITVDSEIVLLEGNYLLLDTEGWKELSDYADYTISISANEDMLRDRLVTRRIASGHEKESAAAFVDFSDMYNVRLCAEHSKKADLMLKVDADGNFNEFNFSENEFIKN